MKHHKKTLQDLTELKIAKNLLLFDKYLHYENFKKWWYIYDDFCVTKCITGKLLGEKLGRDSGRKLSVHEICAVAPPILPHTTLTH